MVEGRGIVLRLCAYLSGGNHQHGRPCRKPIDLVRQIPILDLRRRNRSKARHSMRRLHVRNSRSQQVTDAADVGRNIVHRLRKLRYSAGCRGPRKAQQQHCTHPRYCSARLALYWHSSPFFCSHIAHSTCFTASIENVSSALPPTNPRPRACNSRAPPPMSSPHSKLPVASGADASSLPCSHAPSSEPG